MNQITIELEQPKIEEKAIQKGPFRFYTRLLLSELTGLKAANLGELREILKTVPDSCVYYHTHSFLQQHQYLSPEPPNDFAYWVSEVLNEGRLGERLASIDILQYSTVPQLREKLINAIDGFLKDYPSAGRRFVDPGWEFHFIKSVSFIFPTRYVANNLKEFVDILKKITLDSIYFHIFEARLRLEKKTNDFSYWIESSIGDKILANSISYLDPYTFTLEDLRTKIVSLIEHTIKTYE